MEWRDNFTLEELTWLNKEIKWSEIRDRIDDRRNRTIEQVLGVPEVIGKDIWTKKDIQTKLAFYRALYSDSKIEAAIILLTEVLGLDREKLNVNMVLGMLSLYMMLHGLARYIVKISIPPTKMPVESVVFPFITEEAERKGEDNGMYG